jgi:hypothetical protein
LSRGSGGPPLLLIHGGYGLTRDFDPLAERWSRDRRVIAVERPRPAGTVAQFTA